MRGRLLPKFANLQYGKGRILDGYVLLLDNGKRMPFPSLDLALAYVYDHGIVLAYAHREK